MSMSDDLVIVSEEKDGVLGLAHRAEHELAERDETIGVLGLELQDAGDTAVGVEVAFAERLGRAVIERLELHFELPQADVLPRDLIEEALGKFGGRDYTNLCLRAEDRELADVTIHFATRFKFFATQTALVGDVASESERKSVSRVLSALGVRHGEDLSIPKWQIRGRMTVGAQLAAFATLAKEELSGELYAASLPAVRAAHFALTEGRVRSTLTRRLGDDAPSIASDAVQLSEFARERLGLELAGKRWLVSNSAGKREAFQSHAPVESRNVQWSLNWGARRR